MSEREVIDLVDSDGDDTVEVLHENTIQRSDSQNAIRINSSANATRNVIDDEDDDDDIQIVEERINVPERSTPSPPAGFVIHAPGGPIPTFSNEGSAEPERRSFQNSRGIAHNVHFRRAASRDDVARRQQEDQHQLQRQIQRSARLREAEESLRNRRASRRPRLAAQRPRIQQQQQQRGYPGTGPYDGAQQGFLAPWDFPYMFMRDLPRHFNNIFFQDYDEDEDPNYYPGAGDQMNFNNNGVDQHIMNIIEQRENQEADKKRSNNENATRAHQQTCADKIQTIKSPYSNAIEQDEDYICILCGVTLGEGIPEDFRGNVEHVVLPILQEQNDVMAPYQALKMITIADRDLSKRIFMSSCGHTYCGRCVKSISTVKDALKRVKGKFKKNDNNIENPFVYAPSRCVGPECNITLGAKKRFNEVFI